MLNRVHERRLVDLLLCLEEHLRVSCCCGALSRCRRAIVRLRLAGSRGPARQQVPAGVTSSQLHSLHAEEEPVELHLHDDPVDQAVRPVPVVHSDAWRCRRCPVAASRIAGRVASVAALLCELVRHAQRVVAQTCVDRLDVFLREESLEMPAQAAVFFLSLCCCSQASRMPCTAVTKSLLPE
jgi:hypothetical protein